MKRKASKAKTWRAKPGPPRADSWAWQNRIANARGELAHLRLVLVDIQQKEPHHARIGKVVGNHTHPPTLEQVCRRCPSRGECGPTSEVMAEHETLLFSLACGVCGTGNSDRIDDTSWCFGCQAHICHDCDSDEDPGGAHSIDAHISDPIQRAVWLEKRAEKKPQMLVEDEEKP